MSGWVLSVDFGTSNTAACVCPVGEPERGVAVKLASASTEMPSGVLVHRDGHLLVGEVARNSAAAHPAQSYNPTPKRHVGEGRVPLGGTVFTDVDLVAAVLQAVAARAGRRFGGSIPAELRLTHPAAWAEFRVDVLRRAAAQAGLPAPLLVPEPVAAATYYAQLQAGRRDLPREQHGQAEHGRVRLDPEAPVAVYDIGGGTVDIAVLQPTGDGTFTISAVHGVDPLGGELFDDRLLELVGEALAVRGREQLWDRFAGADALARRRTLHDEVRRAKHTLSEEPTADIAVAAGEDDEVVTVTRAEFHDRISADLRPSLAALSAALQTAGTTPDQLAALYLVGGSSFIPLVADLLTRHLGIAPATFDDPKTVTALGALGVTPPKRPAVPLPVAAPSRPVSTPRPPTPASPPTPVAPSPPTADRGPFTPPPGPTPPTPPPGSRRKWIRPAVWASAVVVALLVAVVALVARPDPELPALTGLTAERTAAGVTLSWDAFPDADSYNILRSNDAGPEFFDATAQTYIDTSAGSESNSYSVWAEDQVGKRISDYARASVSVEAAEDLPPDADCFTSAANVETQRCQQAALAALEEIFSSVGKSRCTGGGPRDVLDDDWYQATCTAESDSTVSILLNWWATPAAAAEYTSDVAAQGGGTATPWRLAGGVDVGTRSDGQFTVGRFAAIRAYENNPVSVTYSGDSASAVQAVESTSKYSSDNTVASLIAELKGDA